MARQGNYVDPYFVKEKNKKATELMPMAFQSVLGYNERNRIDREESLHWLTELFRNDKELFDFTIGLIFRKRGI